MFRDDQRGCGAWHSLRVEHFGTPGEFRDYFPVALRLHSAVYGCLVDDPERMAALNRELAEVDRRHVDGGRME